MSPTTRQPAVVPRATLTAVRQTVRARLLDVRDRRYRELLRLVLARPGRLLARGTPTWVSLPLACAYAASGEWAAGVPVAAALEITAATLELLDDLEDGDLAPTDPLRTISPPRLLNAATGLLMLGPGGLPAPAATRLMTAVLTAAAGQEHDLAGEGAGYDEEACIRIAAAKSGALVACATQLGAEAGGAPEELVALYARLGRHLGLAGQYANDLHALDPERPHNDLLRRKPTVLLAAAGLTGAAPTGELMSEAELVRRVHDSGAANYVWLLAEVERGQALRLVNRLAARGQQVEPLRRLVQRPLSPAPVAPPASEPVQ